MKKVLSILFILCATCCSITAQKAATIKSFTQTTDHIPGNERRKDLNGNPCALVKIQVVDNVERVEGNKIGDIVKRGVENWVYMCKGSRNMRIHLKNHLPVRVVFQNYHINGLESNRVYELVLEIPDAPAPSMEQILPVNNNAEQKLTLNYTPTEAMVLIDSKPYKGDGQIELMLPVGEHSYLIAAEGYITAEATVKLQEYAPRVITETLVADPTYAIKPAVPVVENSKKGKKKKGVLPTLGGAKKRKTSAPETYKNKKIKTSKEIKQKKEHTPKAPKPHYKSFTFTSVENGIRFRGRIRKDGTMVIKWFESTATEVIIPSHVSLDGHDYEVKEIDTFISGVNYGSTKLVIPEGVEVIARYAFNGCRNLTDVTIPNSVVTIGKNAFRKYPLINFNLPAKINVDLLRAGKEIKLKK